MPIGGIPCVMRLGEFFCENIRCFNVLMLIISSHNMLLGFNLFAELSLLSSHGFGLPHTDEDPYNENLGNCLDYTVDPAANLYPGNANYEKLSGMYLSRRKLRRLEGNDRHVIETHMLVVDWNIVEGDEEET